MLRNLATALFLTERDESYYEGLSGADGSKVNPPAYKGRVVTTIHKAKEVKPLVEKCITIAKKALPAIEAAEALNTSEDRNSAAWKQWREGEGWQKWNAAIAPATTARRRAFALLRDKEAVEILFEDVAPRFVDRTGGYTRVMRLAKPRLGDAGVRAILEFVGVHDRVNQVSEKPSFSNDDTPETSQETVPAAAPEEAAEPAAEAASDE
jgi:large subunit ribosomal protein L17